MKRVYVEKEKIYNCGSRSGSTNYPLSFRDLSFRHKFEQIGADKVVGCQ